MSFEVTKMTFDLVDEKGKKYQKILEKEDCQIWHENNIKLSELAYENNIDFKWSELGWKLVEVKNEDEYR